MPPRLSHVGNRVVVSVAIAAALLGYANTASASPGNVDSAIVDVDTTLGYQNESSAGTGIVLSSSGEILTNNHVILNATSVRVTDVGNGRSYPATVVGYDEANDIAVLKLEDASGLKTIALGSSAGLEVGQAVTAIGNAGGAGSPSTVKGRVTALGRSITARNENGTTEPLRDLIETNAATKSGDSGGPLVDSAGRVVGINTAAIQDAQGRTMAYAIPIARALSIANLIEAGRPTATSHIGPAPFLGIDVTATVQGSGALVNLVLPGSPAAKAGIASGDLITMIAGRKISSLATLTKALLHSSPKDTVSVSWVDRSGASHHAGVRLGTGPSQ